jgi:hypothetical protein
MANIRPVRIVTGTILLRSQLGSNQWRLEHNGAQLARLRRFPRNRMSIVELADTTVWALEPRGWGNVEALEDGAPIAAITKTSWTGRSWELSARQFSYNLVSRPAPRRWYFALGNEPVAELAGSIVSYNRLRIEAPIGIPVVAVVLAWQVVARPWEQAAFPIRSRSILTPAQRSPATGTIRQVRAE